jgi:IclR family transcriptional regulator, acetate operon repressor
MTTAAGPVAAGSSPPSGQTSTETERDTPRNGTRLITAAIRCLSLIDVFAAARGPLSISDLAQKTGDRKGTIHQRVTTLVASGWVEQLPDSRYRLTLRSVLIGGATLEQADLGSRVLPVLKALAAETGETATLSALYGGGAIVIQEARTEKPLRLDVHVGTTLPLATSAAGQALAAFGSPAEIEHAAAVGADLPAADVVQDIRERGYAIQEDGYITGISAVAVVVTSTRLGSVALAVTSPSSRFHVADYLSPILQARSQIERLLAE